MTLTIPDIMLTDRVSAYTEATLETAENPQSDLALQVLAGTAIPCLAVPLTADEQMTVAGPYPEVDMRFYFKPGAPVTDRTILQFESGSQPAGTRYVIRGEPLKFAPFSDQVSHIEALARKQQQ